MTTLREAATQALEALQNCANGEDDVLLTRDALAALRAALAEEALQRLTDANQEIEAVLEQPEQEPVAWCDIEEDGTIHGLRYWSEPGRREHALYTHPPRREWRGLTEEEVDILWRKWVGTQRPNYSFTRAVEAALRSKNHE